MKKVLFATTALVASTGIAAAEVALSGSAEMGIVGGTGMDIQFHTDIDVTFTMSGETDNGLTFGASVDIDESVSGAAFASTTQGGESVFLSGNFGTITMGDTDGAFDWALQEALAGGGSINGDEEHGGYNGNGGLDGNYDGQVVRYDYSFGDFSVALSGEVDDTGFGDPILGVGFRYNADLGGLTLGVGVGFQTGDTVTGGVTTTTQFINKAGTPADPSDDFLDSITFTTAKVATSTDVWGLSLDAQFENGLRAIVNYSDLDNNNEHYAIALGYETGAIAVGVNYGEFNNGASGFGLAASYDLGGGAAIQFGYGSTDPAGAGSSTDSYSLGVSMSF